jgi:hypothetical protein
MKKKVYICQPQGFEPVPVVAGFNGSVVVLMSFDELWVLLYEVENNLLKEIDLEDPQDTCSFNKPHFNERKEILRIYHEYCVDCVKEKEDEN